MLRFRRPAPLYVVATVNTNISAPPQSDRTSPSPPKLAYRAKEQLTQARYGQVTIAIQKQIDGERAILAGARQIAANTPSELAAAGATQRQDTARYQSGLATVVDVAEANRILDGPDSDGQ
jgi:hypothetical protein